MFEKIRKNPLRYIPMIIGGILLAGLLAFLLGFIVMHLWNWLMPVIFGLPKITYWQGWGLVLLAHILFKAGPHRHDHDDDDKDHLEWKIKFRKKIKEKFAGGEEAGEDTETDQGSEPPNQGPEPSKPEET
jgi:hypothetical protein